MRRSIPVSRLYKTDVFVDVAEEVVVTMGREQDDAACERRKFRPALPEQDGIGLNRHLSRLTAAGD